jgi:hypothetical protein
MARLVILTCDGCARSWRGQPGEEPTNWEQVIIRGRTYDLDAMTCLGKLGMRLIDTPPGADLAPISVPTARARRHRTPTPATAADFTP